MAPTSSQEVIIAAWERSHSSELVEMATSYGCDLGDLDSQEASLLISMMIASYGEPKLGKNGEQEEQDEQGEGEDEENKSNDGDKKQDGENQQENQQEGENTMENNYREGSKEQIIAKALIENNLNTDLAYNQIKDQIGQKPLEFCGNVDGGRVPLPIGSDYDKSSDKTQKGRTKKTINDVKRALLEKNGEQGQGQGESQDESKDGQNKGQGQSGDSQANEYELLLESLNKAREICHKMSADGEPFDTVGLRPYVHAPKMLSQGFPRAAIIDAMTMTWPKEVRRELNDGKDLPVYDQRKFPKAKAIEPMPLDEIEKKLKPLAKKTTGKSAYLTTMISLADIGVPILQVGEKGTGKTTNAEHLAVALAEKYGREMPFGFASMTSGTSPGEFKGRITLDGFLPSLFEEIYENGGVFLFDELDAGDENLLTLLNSALANGYFVNAKGKVIRQHEHAIPVAAANTMGLGANGRYTGRNRLDAATLDRWAMGRVRVDFDQNLAEYVFWNNAQNSMA